MVQCPDHAGGAEIQEGRAVADAIVLRMRRPEMLRIEGPQGIINDGLDRQACGSCVPELRPQWDVTGGLKHHCPLIHAQGTPPQRAPAPPIAHPSEPSPTAPAKRRRWPSSPDTNRP